MQDFGCHVQGRMAFGQSNGRPFSTELLDAGEGTQVMLQFVAGGNTAAAARALRAQKTPHQIWHSQRGEHDTWELTCLYTPPSDFYTKAGISDVLHAAQQALQEADLPVPEDCPLCGLGSCDVYAWLDGAYRPAHSACLDTRLDLPQEDTPLPKRSPGHVLPGIVGALLGAVIGALPIWVLAMNNGVIHFALYVFIPILSALMYRLFRGRANANIGGVVVLVASLLAALGLEMIWFWLVKSAEFGLNLPFWETTQFYFESHTLALSVREMMWDLVALLVGYLAAARFIRRYADESRASGGIIRGTAFIRASARPIQ